MLLLVTNLNHFQYNKKGIETIPLGRFFLKFLLRFKQIREKYKDIIDLYIDKEEDKEEKQFDYDALS